MIIFDLDGTLADCEHRRHFVDPSKDPKAWKYSPDDWRLLDKWNTPCAEKKWKPDWSAFYEACDKDEPIRQVINIFNEYNDDEYNQKEIQIWSGRSESVRDKTEIWLNKYTSFGYMNCQILKMRPIGNTEPDEVLKERWLDELIELKLNDPTERGKLDALQITESKFIEFVFDDRPKVIRMWRLRGIFVFNCCQHDEEF
jgi:hypothetical protein